MATRPIVTSQPVLSCDMCGRRLLRGERPESFRAGTEPRTVCELCAPRAPQEGWLREADFNASLTMRPSRRRRGVSLLDRLRQLREPSEHPFSGGAGWERREPDLLHEPDLHEPSLHEPDLSDEALEGLVDEGADWRASSTPGAVHERIGGGAEPMEVGGVGDSGTARERGHDSDMERALEIFNEGEHPRRMGGVARSLGTPVVTARMLEGSPARFTIVVAWELCWYRYEVDLDDEQAGAQLVEKGMELAELPVEDQADNVAAGERGELVLR